MKQKIILLKIAIMLCCISAFSQNAYITQGNGIAVIDTKTNTVITTIQTPYEGPDAVVVSPDGTRAFITYYNFTGNGDNIVSVINTSTNTIMNHIDFGPSTLLGVDGIDISPDGSKLYFAGIAQGGQKDTVFVVNAATGSILSKIIMPLNSSEGIAISPDGKKVYIAESNLIVVIDAVTNTISTTIDMGQGAYLYGIAVCPDGSKVYAADLAFNAIKVVSTVTNTIIASIDVSGRLTSQEPFGIAVSPDGSRVYASNMISDKVAVINAVNNTFIDTVPAGYKPYGLALNLDGSRLYVANFGAPGSVTVLNTTDNSIIATIPTGGTGPVAFGKFIGGPLVDTTSGSYQASGSNAPVIKDTFYNALQNNTGKLYAEINPHGNNLGATNWGAIIEAGNDIRNTFGWFGKEEKEYGAFMKRNFYFSPTTQPTSDNTVRLYCTNTDIQNFLDSFNVQYGANKTINDIQIIKYDGSHVDLDWSNNDDDSLKYSSIVPTQIGYYGFNNDFRFFEFQVSSYSEFWLALTSKTGVLPIELISFDAEKQGDDVLLKWQTATEQNSSSIDVERSADGIKFFTVNTVKAAGNSSTTRNYAVTDYNPVSPRSYYRLKFIDKDGQFSYSKIISINIDGKSGFELYPNPAQNTINIQLNTIPNNNEVARIIDMKGNVLKTIPITNNTGLNYTLNVEGLAKGNYIIQIGGVSKQFIKL